MKKTIGLFLILLFCAGTLKAMNEPKFVGSIKSNKYHYTACRYVHRIEKRYLRTFNTPEEAIRLGYLPCKICHPSTSTEGKN